VNISASVAAVAYAWHTAEIGRLAELSVLSEKMKVTCRIFSASFLRDHCRRGTVFGEEAATTSRLLGIPVSDILFGS